MFTRVLTTLAIALLLVPSLQAMSTTSPVLARTTKGQLVYHWNFTKGMTGWTSPTTGWVIKGGMLTYDGKNNSALKAPYELPSYLSNFAVEAVIKAVAKKATGVTYGLGVGAYYGENLLLSGTTGGYGCFYCQKPGPYLWASYTRASQPLTLKPGFHTYRLEVRDVRYKLLIDGKATVHATIKDAMNGPGLGIYASLYQIKVKSFKVYSLQYMSQPGSHRAGQRG